MIEEALKKVKEKTDDLRNIRISAESGAGLVKVVVNGQKELVQIEIAPSLMRKEDKKMLEYLIIGAVKLANEKAQKEIEEKLKGYFRKDGLSSFIKD